MKYDISFIHTGEAHVEKFNSLVEALAPELLVSHVVDESLLAHAQQFGVDATLKAKLRAIIEKLSLETRIIVVTCSSIGSVAEDVGSINGCNVQRVDRAMADYAAAHADNILVVAALQSTLKPTKELLQDSIKKTGSSSKIMLNCIDDAWQYFLSGQMEKYYDEIAHVLMAKQQDYDLILLAQASMSDVESRIKLCVPVLSSPRIGVERAIRSLLT